MLGCQDFCGYYDWTFHHVRQRYGQDAVRTLWAEAIGGESQRHYAEVGAREGLRGLYNTWIRTGQDEHCEWTFTLDEEKNVLRWDMRECPSKGFLLQNDLQADEDYCDHCVGWIKPLLAWLGMEVTAHEHNHCGQCWGELSERGRPSTPLDLPGDIRRDPRWNGGYLEVWKNGVKQPVLAAASPSPDSVDVLEQWFAGCERFLVVGDTARSEASDARGSGGAVLLVTDGVYADHRPLPGDPRGVLIGVKPGNLQAVAERFRSTPPDRRPLLMHAYLPGATPIDFVSAGLPRPLPILPRLIRKGLYVHQPGVSPPSNEAFLTMLASSLRR